jgi:hypothetical protein
MGDANDSGDKKAATQAERRLRGEALEGSERKNSADHAEYEKTRRPDTELHLDDEKDTLYDDGLDVEEDTDTLAGTRGSSSGVKP